MGSNAGRAECIFVSGAVSGVWSADTVMVLGDITVSPASSLSIEPGVQVRFTGWYKFIIMGELRAVGNIMDSILFTRAYPTEESKWRGFRFDAASDSSVLEYCRVEYARGTEAYPDVRGGGIWINHCSPTVRRCRILNNYSHNGNYNGMGAGICLNENSFSLIEQNHILLNLADSGGGISIGWGSNAIVRNNRIEINTAYYAGGGIYVSADAEATICDNVILGNYSSGYGGGGINLWSATWLYGTFSTVYGNLISDNIASDAGGGIYSRYDASQMYENTIVANQSGRGGGIYVLTFSNLPPTIYNSIIWGNVAGGDPQVLLDPISGSTADITYCDVQGGWAGLGNINQDPAFLDTLWEDYRLQWGSPCIDSGDPNPIHNDPDGTRGDMGAFYFDQSAPVRITLTPHNAPITIPPGGGPFDYTLQGTNIQNNSLQVRMWCDITLPNGAVRGPVFGPVSISLAGGVTVSRQRTQVIPGSTAAGLYHYNAYACVGADSSKDSFEFVKLDGGGEYSADGWDNWGDPFDQVTGDAPIVPQSHLLALVRPNPFNSSASISFRLPEGSTVQLRVFDLTGRSVSTLLSGQWLEEGWHQVALNADAWSAGIYIYGLATPKSNFEGKLVLLK
jgi:hypothetical protein